MKSTLVTKLKKLRENYYFSLLLAGIAEPLWHVCHYLSLQLPMKVQKNGVRISLPNGKSMAIGRNAGVALASSLFWHGLDGYEPATSTALRFFFARSQTFIDVGANCGLYSIIAVLWNSEIKVVAFEAYTPIYLKLKKNVELNCLDGRIVCENLALSNQSGIATFHIPSSESQDFETTGTLAADSWQTRKNSPTVSVEAMRFDEYESKHPMRVDLIKIDVEDFEADVLQGMYATIERDRPFIVCEILPRNKEHRNERTRKLVEALNYTAYWITASGYIRVSRFDFERKDSKDFILSPVSTAAEVIDDLTVLFELRLRA